MSVAVGRASFVGELDFCVFFNDYLSISVGCYLSSFLEKGGKGCFGDGRRESVCLGDSVGDLWIFWSDYLVFSDSFYGMVCTGSLFFLASVIFRVYAVFTGEG